MRSILAIAAILTGPVALEAATLQYLGSDDLINRSTSIVRGKVTAAAGVLRGSSIYTSYHVQVLETLKGAPAAQLDLAVPGGVANGLREMVPGAPKLSAGEEYVLFLWTSKSGLTQIIGLSQGLFSLVKSAEGMQMAVRAAVSDTLVDLPTGRTVTDRGMQFPLDDLRRRTASMRTGTKGGASK